MLVAARVRASPPRCSIATVGGVRVSGLASNSRVGDRREPRNVLVNLCGNNRAVDFVARASFGDGATATGRASDPWKKRGT